MLRTRSRVAPEHAERQTARYAAPKVVITIPNLSCASANIHFADDIHCFIRAMVLSASLLIGTKSLPTMCILVVTGIRKNQARVRAVPGRCGVSAPRSNACAHEEMRSVDLRFNARLTTWARSVQIFSTAMPNLTRAGAIGGKSSCAS
jgi:hypothetical protein